MNLKKQNEAFGILSSYNGLNPYILNLKAEYLSGKMLSDFNVDYVIANKDFKPIPTQKLIRVADWFAQRKMDDWSIEFLPEKLLIVSWIGETDTCYHVYAQYRQSVPPKMLFLPKKAVLTNFTCEDYHNVVVDFERYDRLMQAHKPEENRSLMNHQKEAIQFLLSRKKCILADDMGLGKSCELSVAAVEGNFDSVLIICPASLKTQWKDELEYVVPSRDITIIEGYTDKTKPELEKYLGYGIGKSGKKISELKEEAKERGKWEDNRFVIVNFDILDEFFEFEKSRSKANLEESFNNSPILQYISNKKSLIIVDESHKLANNTSGRYKIVDKLIKRGKPHSIFLATGTPITNNPGNFYNLLKLIGDSLADDWEYYMQRYCGSVKIHPKGEKEKWTNIFLKKKRKFTYGELTNDERKELYEFIKCNARTINKPTEPGNLEELRDRASHIYLRRTKEELRDLPNKTIHEVFYDLDSVQKSEYDRLWNEYEEEKMLQDPTAELNKDLVEGSIYRKYCSDQMVPKTIRLAEYFINRGEKVVIACCFDNELYALKEHFGDKCVVYNGKMLPPEKDKAKNAFLHDDNKQVFIGNIISAGVGLNLVVSHVLIFNDMSYVPGDNRQMEDRVYRIGQKHDVDIYYQMFKNTQYERMWNIVMKKELTINSVIKTENEKK